MDDTFLVAMVLKGLPEEFKAFIAVVTQSEVHQIFQKLKQLYKILERQKRLEM